MAFKIGIGKSDFEDLRTSKDYYVDKTEFIYDLVESSNSKVSLFTRPRRFGKTLMLNMMDCFFNIRKDSREIFNGLDIMEHKEFCGKWMNKYPLLFVSFKDVEALTFEDAFKMLKAKIAEVCREISDLADNDRLSRYNTDILDRYMSKTADKEEIINSLKTIMEILHRVYGKKVILLIDEYDVPLAKANEMNSNEKDFYGKMLDVIKGIMSTALKDNKYLEFAVITGCLRIAKESIFTGVNNFASYSVLNKKFSRYFGFTQNEVDKLLKNAGLEDKSDVIKAWYDGYIFGDSYIYCPWDVVNYVSDLCYDRESQPRNYWKNTSHNGILLTFVERTDFYVEEKFEVLMNDGFIEEVISDELTYDTLYDSEENLWSILLMSGYITKKDVNDNCENESVGLKIPNREITAIFENTVVSHFKKNLNRDVQKSMMEALWNEDEDAASKEISKLLWKTISYNDYHENYYHAFLAGIFVGIGYEVFSNKERGNGRPDILLLDRENRRVLIIEAKRSKKEDDMPADCLNALKEIDEKEYAVNFSGYNYILKYGIAFFQKKAMVIKGK